MSGITSDHGATGPELYNDRTCLYGYLSSMSYTEDVSGKYPC